MTESITYDDMTNNSDIMNHYRKGYSTVRMFDKNKIQYVGTIKIDPYMDTIKITIISVDKIFQLIYDQLIYDNEGEENIIITEIYYFPSFSHLSDTSHFNLTYKDRSTQGSGLKYVIERNSKIDRNNEIGFNQYFNNQINTIHINELNYERFLRISYNFIYSITDYKFKIFKLLNDDKPYKKLEEYFDKNVNTPLYIKKDGKHFYIIF